MHELVETTRKRILEGRVWFASIAAFLVLESILSARDLRIPFASWSGEKILIFGEVYCLLLCA